MIRPLRPRLTLAPIVVRHRTLARDMDETGGTEQVPYTRVTVAEAAAILGVNVVTVRRMIKRGQLEAERVHRPQGSAYLVTLPGDGAGDATSTGQPAQDVSRTQGTSTPPAEAMVSLIQTTIGTILGPLVGELDRHRQTIERQAETIAELREDRGRQSAELERARAEIDALTSSAASGTAQSTPRSPGTFLRAWAHLDWLIVGLVVAVVVAGAILAWPR